ncbi:ATP-binding protein [Candidatus Accumulibacter sp. ACC003]|jgi:PAS domain S-box-containing protein|uniref:sensor histidine kinase n=1 Tax=Candidatus Accumulibacter sp. ACC003 TaxID=2823334 RepID=UPI0025C32BCA|nr:ATP-binding protein [Candidatus Accumulibacter sp. ACC003]
MQCTVEQQARPPSSGACQRWVGGRPAATIALTLALVVLVAALDYATGYELRLAILYLIPIAFATWAGGTRAGVVIVAVSTLSWLASFRSMNPYSGVVFFYWEGVVMVAMYLTVVVLLARLRVALSEADARFFRVLEELHAAVYVADEDSGAVLYANRGLLRLLDGEPQALGGKALDERFGCRDSRTGASHGARSEAAGTAFVAAEVRDQSNGHWYLVQAGPIPWNGGQRVSLKVITDISEQKNAQTLKRQHQEMLHQTTYLAALGEIATSLAHEVNQPLTAIASYKDACLRMLAATDVDRKQLVAAMKRCREQALRAGRIIGRVRDFVRSRRPHPSQCDINALLREALELMETQLEDSAVTVELSLSDALPINHADRTLLVQVIVNLIQNGIDAMATSPPSRRKLSVSTATAADGSFVVAVADQGVGISQAIEERLYLPFVTTKSQGLGLGLSICRSVVEAHGGHLGHSANADGGATFHFSLPPEPD